MSRIIFFKKRLDNGSDICYVSNHNEKNIQNNSANFNRADNSHALFSGHDIVHINQRA